jgi:hypothetical protein
MAEVMAAASVDSAGANKNIDIAIVIVSTAPSPCTDALAALPGASSWSSAIAAAPVVAQTAVLWLIADYRSGNGEILIW